MDEMVTIWRRCRAGGFASGHLPQAGGVGEQAALMLDALDAMDAALSVLRPERGR